MAQSNTYYVVLFDHHKNNAQQGSAHNPVLYHYSTAADRGALQTELDNTYDPERYSILEVVYLPGMTLP